eukprot:SAG11_NODE_889_length_6692_cov_6.292280_4_plen_119_part_00
MVFSESERPHILCVCVCVWWVCVCVCGVCALGGGGGDVRGVNVGGSSCVVTFHQALPRQATCSLFDDTTTPVVQSMPRSQQTVWCSKLWTCHESEPFRFTWVILAILAKALIKTRRFL